MIARFGISYERARNGAPIIDDRYELERDKAERPAGRSTTSQPAVETHANSSLENKAWTQPLAAALKVVLSSAFRALT